MRTEYRAVLVCTDACRAHRDWEGDNRIVLDRTFHSPADATSYAHQMRHRAYGSEHTVELEQRQVSEWEPRP